MNIRSTIIVFILATLSAAAAFYTHNSDNTNNKSTNSVFTLITPDQLPRDQISKITLKRGNDESIVYSLTDNGWAQSEPFAFKMNPFSMRQLLILPSQIMVSQEIASAQQTGNLSTNELSLEPPLAELTYEWDGAKLKLQFGRKAVAGRWYVYIAGRKTVYIATGDLYLRAVETDLKEWRDRTIFTDASVNADKIVVKLDNSEVEIQQDQKQWKMNTPVSSRLDDLAIDEFFQALGRAKSSGFIVDQPRDLSDFGLANPKGEVNVYWTLVTSKGGEIIRTPMHEKLLLGASKGIGSGDRFAMMQGQPVVFILPEKMLTGIFRNASTLVARTASGIEPADIKAIEIRDAQRTFRLERSLERWVAPEHHVNVPPAYVNKLLDNLTNLKAPEIEIKTYPSELQVATITFIGFDSFAMDTVRIALDPDTKQWALENGDNVLRIFPASLQLRLTPEDFGISP